MKPNTSPLLATLAVTLLNFCFVFDSTTALLPPRVSNLLSSSSTNQSPFSRQVEQEDSRNRQQVWDWLDRIHNERRSSSSQSQSHHHQHQPTNTFNAGSSRTISPLSLLSRKPIVFATARPPSVEESSTLDGEDEDNPIAARPESSSTPSRKLPRDAIGEVEVDYADEDTPTSDTSTHRQLPPTSPSTSESPTPDLIDQMRASIESAKLCRTCGATTLTTTPRSTTTTTSTATTTTTTTTMASPTPMIRPPPSSSSISAMLKFSSNRTNAKSATIGQLPSINGKNHQRRQSGSGGGGGGGSAAVLSLPPVTDHWSFRCPAGKSGYFADTDNDCRVYYVCSSERGERQRFVCPAGTRFNQAQANCDWWDKVVCERTSDQQ